ncbi:universal stress protein [Amycolatopsis taiwanensis]|uniref:Universal stress protein n=1 Tax=Amycolatopsis taiwanensis TaxID=342230 RepID=A0A9W6R5R2_9PSEU|nr:universal stress protein [Amycolatopsis taiwanensis]GLY69934.1 universal stress protein [Amycolatopsis taiwanensis]
MTAADGAVVVGIDGSPESERALDWAADEAALRDATLHLVYAFAPLAAFKGAGLPVLRDTYSEFAGAGRRLLEEASAMVGGRVAVTTDMLEEPPVRALLELSGRARMIVLGAVGAGGFVGMLAGSTAVSVSAHARCPVVIVRGSRRPGPVVVGVDGSQAGARAIAAAFDEAAWRKATLVAVHAVQDREFLGTSRPDQAREAGQAVLAESLAGWQEKYPDVRVERVIVPGRPRHQLLDHSERAQLVVTGSRGRGGFAGLVLGSTSQALIHHADCPVMVVPGERT